MKYMLLLLLVPGIAKAESLGDFAKSQVGKMSGVLNEANLSKIPLSPDARTNVTQLEHMSDEEMKDRANAMISPTAKDSVSKTAAEISRRPPVDGMEKTSVLLRAEKVWGNVRDALGSWLNCTDGSAAEQAHYTKRKKIVIQHDIELEQKMCEKPAGGIVCERTLDVAVSIPVKFPGWVKNGSVVTFYGELKNIPFEVIDVSKILSMTIAKAEVNGRRADSCLITLNGKVVAQISYFRERAKGITHLRGDVYELGEDEWVKYCKIDGVDVKGFLQNGANSMAILHQSMPGKLEIHVKYEELYDDQWGERCWQE